MDDFASRNRPIAMIEHPAGRKILVPVSYFGHFDLITQHKTSFLAKHFGRDDASEI
jgi:hypothetical protein